MIELRSIFASPVGRVPFMFIMSGAEEGQVKVLVREGQKDKIVRCEASRDGMHLRMLKKDAVGKLVDTNLIATHAPRFTLRDPAWWSRKDNDERFIGQYEGAKGEST